MKTIPNPSNGGASCVFGSVRKINLDVVCIKMVIPVMTLKLTTELSGVVQSECCCCSFGTLSQFHRQF